MKMRKINIYIISALVFIFLFGCGRGPKEGEPVNFYGGSCRTNSYEEFGSFYHKIFLVDELTYKDSSGAVTAPLVLPNSDFVIVNVSSNVLYISKQVVKWSVNLDSVAIPAGCLAADGESNIYIIANNGVLYSISKEGKIRWKKQIAETNKKLLVFSDLLTQKDGIVVSVSDGDIYKFSFNGDIKWKINPGLSSTKTFASDENGNLVIPLTHDMFGVTDTLLFISSDGKILWQKGFDKVRLYMTPTVYKNKIVIAGINDLIGGRLEAFYVLDSKGKQLWKKELNVTPRFISVDEDGKIYVAGYNTGVGEALSEVLCFSPEGKLEWKQYFQASVTSDLMISRKIIAFVANDEKGVGVFFLRKDGTFEDVVPLQRAPSVYPQPAVTSDPSVIFAGSDRLCIVRIDELPFDKFLPW
jgi:outer membrane protein assembly factor BamB